MAFQRGPNIVTNGLVLALDAANTKSYPGSGTTWRDISSNRYDFTLINGPTYNPAYNGGIEQDGVDDYIDRPYTSDLAFNGNTSFTIQLVARTKTLRHNLGTYPAIMSNGDGDSGGGWDMILYDDNNVYGGPFGVIAFSRYQNGGAYINAGGSCTYSFTSLADANSMNFWCYTYSSTGGGILYRNGSVLTTSPTTGSITRGTTPNIYLGRRTLNASRVSNCIFYTVQAYNRTLSASEIEQNYNAQKSRFNL